MGKKLNPWLKRQVQDSFKLRTDTYYGLLGRLAPEDKLELSDVLDKLKAKGIPEKSFPVHFEAYKKAAKKALEQIDQANKNKLMPTPHDAMLLFEIELQLKKEGLRAASDCMYTLALLIERASRVHPKLKKLMPLTKVELPPEPDKWEKIKK